jgi:hypothetical protein
VSCSQKSVISGLTAAADAGQGVSGLRIASAMVVVCGKYSIDR